MGAAPQQAHNQWVIATAVVEADPEAAILDGAESRVPRLPLIRALWDWVGQRLRIPMPGPQVPRALCGALHIRTGQWV